VGCARDIRRVVSVLFVAGLWALTALWSSAALQAAERDPGLEDDCCEPDCADEACSCCASRDIDRAAPATRKDAHALTESVPALGARVITEVEPRAPSGSVVPRRHDAARFARGPPARG
jgi:hypothetical protein